MKPHPLLLAFIGEVLWFVAGMLTETHYWPIGIVLCAVGGFILGNLAAKVRA